MANHQPVCKTDRRMMTDVGSDAFEMPVQPKHISASETCPQLTSVSPERHQPVAAALIKRHLSNDCWHRIHSDRRSAVWIHESSLWAEWSRSAWVSAWSHPRWISTGCNTTAAGLAWAAGTTTVTRTIATAMEATTGHRAHQQQASTNHVKSVHLVTSRTLPGSSEMEKQQGRNESLKGCFEGEINIARTLSFESLMIASSNASFMRGREKGSPFTGDVRTVRQFGNLGQ